MQKLLLIITVFILFSLHVSADPGDTLIVQTYTFDAQNNPETNYDSPGRRYFDFPEDDGTSYQKILMHYTLKCFEDGTAGGLGFDCGEWDYTSHTFLYQHTGELDSNALSHPRYLANNLEFDEMSFSSIPLVNTFTLDFLQTEISNVISEEEFLVNSGMEEGILISADTPTRVQFYYPNEDLGAVALDVMIQKMSLNFEGESTLSNLKIRTSWLNEAPTEMVNDALEDNFTHPSFSFSTGAIDFFLDTPMEWDGASGLLVDFSFDSSEDQFSILGSTGNSLMSASAEEKYIVFDGEDQVSIPPSVFETVDEEVTIGYWLYGNPAFQPENNSTFEGVNSDNQRVLNCHNPWSNGQVYWDAGQDGGYDRINAQAGTEDYEGEWSHWAFTKNTNTGEMRIFLNGEEWLMGEDKDNSMSGIAKFNIASSAGGTNYYRGAMDDFFVLDKELTAEEIQSYMNDGYSLDLPQVENLIAFFGFNHAYGEPVNNEVSGLDGLSLGNAALQNYPGSVLTTLNNEVAIKPSLSLFSGDYETIESSVLYEVEEELPPISVIEYGVNGNEIEVLNSQVLYPLGFSNLYGLDGETLESVSNEEDTPVVLVNEDLSYFSPPFEVVNRIELGRFITPYGIGLDLEEGWTWIYDVTDFEPLLRGEVELEAGNWQELLDLKFLFIEGTPPREVKRVENVWAGNWGLGAWDENVLEKTMQVQPEEDMFKLRTTTSGHGFGSGNNCGEFCFNNHKLKVNGNTEYNWEVMQECADNPLYPQGGTWIYDRAGWCPGAPVRMREHELTEFVTGDEFTLEYDIDNDPDGNYWFMGQLFSYGEINHELDVEIDQILAPSDFRINSRMNPICDDPVIRITNKGSQPLTSCQIEFGINGQLQISTWNGDLGFMESEDITLTYNVSAEFYNGDEDAMMTFEARIINPNNGIDQNESNNAASSHFFRPPTYSYDEDEDDNRIIIETRTNASPGETMVQLKNIYGATHWTSNYTQANTVYRDTLTLNAGCYLLDITDSAEDGLNFFANNDGVGYVRIREVDGWYFESFQNNFGKEIKHYFNFETNIYDNVPELDKADVRIYPNPSTGKFYLQGIDLKGEISVVVYDVSGKAVKLISARLKDSASRIEIDLENQSTGLYNAVITLGDKTFSKRLMKE